MASLFSAACGWSGSRRDLSSLRLFVDELHDGGVYAVRVGDGREVTGAWHIGVRRVWDVFAKERRDGFR